MLAATELVTLFLLALALVLAVPIAGFAMECLAASFLKRREPVAEDGAAMRPSMSVLIPAHNEEQVLARTIAAVQQQLSERDVLCVVADNCSDGTAGVARACAVEVIERHDETRRGKGFALECGLEHLKQLAPRDVLVILDADCIVQADALSYLARRAKGMQRAVQACYLMEAPRTPSSRDVISQFAVLVKNHVRLRGLDRFGLPVLLTGSGMAFPWSLACELKLGSGHLVEDMQLACDLILKGPGPVFCEEAKIVACLPTGSRAARMQRTRWEHGHLRVLLTQIPRLAGAAFQGGRWSLLATCWDLSVPPLSLLVALWMMAWLLSAAWALNSLVPFLVLSGLGGVLFTAVVVAWLVFARGATPWQALIRVPGYVLFKIPVYVGFLLYRQREWIRTERG